MTFSAKFRKSPYNPPPLRRNQNICIQFPENFAETSFWLENILNEFYALKVLPFKFVAPGIMVKIRDEDLKRLPNNRSLFNRL